MIKNQIGEKFYPTNEKFQPITVIKDNITYFEPTEVTKIGTELSFEKTYNHHCDEIKVYGDYQEVYQRTAVKSDYMIQFEDHQGEYMTVTSAQDCEITRCGRNLFNVNSTLDYYPAYSGLVGTSSIARALIFPYSDKMAVNITNYSYLNSSSVKYGTSDDPIEEGTTITTGNFYSNRVVDNDGKNSLFAFSAYGTGHELDELIGSQIELGETYHDYEEYSGETYSLVADTPTQIPLLEGINTVFATTNGILLNVTYTKADTAESEESDSLSLVSAKCVSGTLTSSKGEDSSSIDIPNLYALYDGDDIIAQDVLYVNGKTGEMWIEKEVSPPSETSSAQALETATEVEMAYSNLTSYPHGTNVEYIGDVDTLTPVVSVTLSQYDI